MSEPLASSIARIFKADKTTVVGAGFLAAARQVLTCAHVVARALNAPEDSLQAPRGKVWLDFLAAAGQKMSAHVILWRPPEANGGGDIAGLELDEDPPPGAQPARLLKADNLWQHDFATFGCPPGQDGGVHATGKLLGPQAYGWVQIEDWKAQGYRVHEGFSGAPVWDRDIRKED